MKHNLKNKLLLALVLFILPLIGHAYSVLTHEALIDAVWDKYFMPLLKEKYPSLNDSSLKEAHAYAYGGAVAPDMGYYPLGSKLFTNLVHYVRTGDFIYSLLNEARNANEYAFALGALCHYYADVYGHRLGVNVTVPLAYPKDRKKFGEVITYEQDKIAHKRVEFAFDVSETAKGNFASNAYHDFIGFKVADSVLERAFYKTYALHLNDVFPSFSRAVNTFRWSVKNFFPVLTKAAWVTKQGDIKKQNPTMTAQQFRYKMNKANYNKEFGKDRDKPGLFSFLFGGLIKILPKVGPLRPLKFKSPDAQMEKIFIKSFDTVQLHYSNVLKILHSKSISLPDKDFDTGLDTKPGAYKLTDQTYCDLLLALKKQDFETRNAALKQNITQFLKDGIALAHVKKNKRRKVTRALVELKTNTAVPAGY
jgi:hypothetical protein